MILVLLRPGLEDLAGAIAGDGELAHAGDELRGCIELVSMHFGMRQEIATDAGKSARNAGRRVLQDITLVKYLDRYSPLLYRHCLSAAPIDNGSEPTRILLYGLPDANGDGGGVGEVVMTIKLFNCMISTVEAQSHPDDMATEQLTLNYTDIHWSTVTGDDQPSGPQGFSYGWSVAGNRDLT
ncbi:MAG: type VI secretion system tube protein Hcp [Pseudomonadota bacterium]